MDRSGPIDTLNVCVLFDVINSPWGGANQFLNALVSELRRQGHTVTNDPGHETQIVLLNGFLSGPGVHLQPSQIAQLRHEGAMNHLGRLIPRLVYRLRKRKGPILIHRLDGVAELARGGRTRADEIQPAVNRLTDHTIFQTDYCRISFAEHCGVVPASWRVIKNAVDPQVFFPSSNPPKREGQLRLVAVSWSSNPRKGFATLADVSRLPGVELTFVGNWCPDVDPAQVKMAGVLGSQELAEVMRSSQALIHAGWNEACSNVIVEAMACGLPVIYRDSGGNRELAGEYGVVLTEDLAATVDGLVRHHDELRDAVLRDRDKFLIHRAANEYLSMFRYAVEGELGDRL